MHEQIGFVEQFEGATGTAFGQHLCQLFADALTAHGVDESGKLANCGERDRFDVEAEAGGEANCAEKAELVFLKAPFGIADGANHACIEIGQTADMVDHSRTQVFAIAQRAQQRIQQEPVDRKIPPLHVLFGAGRIADFVGMAAVGVDAVGAEGRDLSDHLRWGRLGLRRNRQIFAPPMSLREPLRSERQRRRCAETSTGQPQA